MTKITYTPEQAERIEEVRYKLKYALDCLDDLRDALAEVSGIAGDGLDRAKEDDDASAREYFLFFTAALQDVNFTRDDLRAALAIYDKHLGIHTDPSQYNR